MGKSVLILSSSPRRGGNSDTLCDAFAHGAREAGNEVEKIFLGDQDIHFCRGCGVCNKTHKCVQEDDMAAILDRMVRADVLVFASPVYFYTVCGQMKTLIDRTVPRYTEIAHKDVYYIVTAADTRRDNMERAVSCFRGFTLDCLPDAREKGTIYGTGVWQKGEIESSPALAEAYEMGKKV